MSSFDSDTWYCTRGDVQVDALRTLKSIENELFKLGLKAAFRLLP